MSKNNASRTVWVVDLSNATVLDCILKHKNLPEKSRSGTKSLLYYVESEKMSNPVVLTDAVTALSQQSRYGGEWVVQTNRPETYVASSEERAIAFLKDEICKNKKKIKQCQAMLSVYAQDHQSVLNVIQQAFPVQVLIGEESLDRIHVGEFCISKTKKYEKMGQDMRSLIEKRLGVGLDSYPYTKIYIDITRNYLKFYIDIKTVQKIESEYQGIPPVSDDLNNVWASHCGGFDVKFVHAPPKDIRTTFFNRGAQYINLDFEYADIHHALRRQLANVIAVSARTHKKGKTKLNAIQFALSPVAAANSITEPPHNSIVLEYSNGKNSMDCGRYYGINKPITVYCYLRPDNTISLMSESLPEHTLSLSAEQYQEQVTRSNILDTLMI